MEKEINKLLLRQIKRHFGSPGKLPAELTGFLNDISDTYDSLEDDNSLLQLSLELSSVELRDAYLKEKQEADTRKDIINKINHAINALNPASEYNPRENENNDTSKLFESLISLIEQRKQMELSIKESEFSLREILDSMDVGVTIVDSETHEISFVNKRGKVCLVHQMMKL